MPCTLPSWLSCLGSGSTARSTSATSGAWSSARIALPRWSPFPGNGDHLGNAILALDQAPDVAEVDLAVEPDPRQESQEGSVHGIDDGREGTGRCAHGLTSKETA